MRLGFLTVDRGSIRGRPAYAVPFHWLADQLCDAVSAEMTAAKLPATAERRDAAVATYSMDQPLAPLMGPEHPAGDEIAEHGCGDERNRDQENGNAVATFQFTNRLWSYGACQGWRSAIWGAAHPRKRRADFGVKSPSRRPNGTKCLNGWSRLNRPHRVKSPCGLGCAKPRRHSPSRD